MRLRAVRAGWRSVRLSAVAVQDGGSGAWVAVVPIVSGRVRLEGATMRRLSASALPAVRDGYLVVWDAARTAETVARLLGGSVGGWLARTIDVGGLTSSVEREGPETGGSGLASVARRFGVPGTDPRDAMEAALMVGQLFLVVATKLDAEGRGDVSALLEASRRRGPLAASRL